MNLYKLLQSLDELLFEVMGWLLFYPITLWSVLRHPIATAAIAEREAGAAGEGRYDDMLSPPLFLLLTLILSHGVELTLFGESPLVADTDGLAVLVSDNGSLLLFRLFAFSIFPVITAGWLLRWQGGKITRGALERPFFAQCYLAAPYALVSSIAALVARGDHSRAALLIEVAAMAVYLWIQSAWFARHLQIGRWRALIPAVTAYIICLVALTLLATLMGANGR